MCRCYGVLSIPEIGNFQMSAVPLRTPLIKTNQTHLAFWKIVSNYFLISVFSLSLSLFYGCMKWVYKCVPVQAWMPRDGLDVFCIKIGSYL